MTFMLVALLFWPGYNLILTGFAFWFPRSGIPIKENHSFQFWIIIPALNEERVIAATVESALALSSARTPVRVLVVDDGSDDATSDILNTMKDPWIHVLRRELPNARIGKGETLNAAYRWICTQVALEVGDFDKTIIGVIDGDGRGTPGMLDIIANYFIEHTVGGVQSRVRIHNRKRLLGFLQDVEFSCVADSSQSMRDSLGSAELGGNGQFVRLSSLMLLGDSPWSNCLVEDLELGLRLHLHGLRIRYASGAVITQQGLVNVGRMIRQRTRWCQGNLQCFRYVPKLIASPKVKGRALIEFVYYLVAPWFTVPVSLLVLGFLGITTFSMISGDSFFGLTATGIANGTPLILWVGAFTFPGIAWAFVHWFRNHDEPLFRTFLVGLIYPVFLFVGIVATWRAFGRHLSGHNSWTKTERILETVQLAEI